MKKVINMLNYPGSLGEFNDQPSETVPDQTLPIRTILERYSKGLPVNASMRVPLYDEDNELPDPAHLDLAERQAYAELYRQELQDIQDVRLAAEQRKKQASVQGAPKPSQELPGSAEPGAGESEAKASDPA